MKTAILRGCFKQRQTRHSGKRPSEKTCKAGFFRRPQLSDGLNFQTASTFRRPQLSDGLNFQT
ncbi:hypothetical protein ACLD9W_10820, partial [Neisseria sp. WLZKY-1]|uniref:hypothetical protein n=1 Tax=Neisseria sp. WLZKY-1 TaxID=3390377 RepID=UPI003978491E